MLFVGGRTNGWYCGLGSLILMNNFFLCLVFFTLSFINRFRSWAFEEVADRLVVIGILFYKFKFVFSWLLGWKLRF